MSQPTDTTEKVHLLISEDRERELLNLLDCAYIQSSITKSFLPVIHWLRDKGEKLEISDILFLQKQFGRSQGFVYLPFPVVRFYSQLLNSRKVSLVLDPAGGLGLLGACLSLSAYVQKIDVVTSYTDSEELISPLNLSSLSLHIGDVATVREKLATKYDAIVSISSIGMGTQRRTFWGGTQHRIFQTVDGRKIKLNDEPYSLLIAEMADLLAQDGMLAFIVSPRFEWDKKANSIRSNLKKFGLYLSALLKIPPGAFLEDNLPFDLIIIEKVDHGNLFVAEVPEDTREQDELITRLWKRKKGSVPSKGWIVTDDQFFGLQALEAIERARKLALSKGLEPIPFSKAVVEINVPKHRGTDVERYEEHPNAIYFPEMAAMKARTWQGDLSERQSYFQLIVDPAVVLPEYLAEMLNTPLGHAIREASMKGTVILRIDKHILAESTLYLPSLVEQKRAVEALSSIRRLQSELAELESKVWERPRKVSSVIDSLSKVNHEERFDEWLDSLPFPLASILRLYHAVDLTDKEKYERLLHFFQAFAEFCAIIHLSAFKKNKVHWETQRETLAILLNDEKFSFERPTFGLWVAIVGLLGGKLRSMLNGNSGDKIAAAELYVTADLRSLDILSSKDLISLLQRANNFRNQWTGHGGAVTIHEAATRHKLLKQDLETFRRIVGTKFLQYQLIEAQVPNILPGFIYQFRVRRVMGSNPQLEHISIELRTPAITGHLYMHNPGHDKLLELIPLIYVRDEPQPAIYFYNRVDQQGLHLVSYHFTEHSDFVEDGKNVQLLLKELNLGGQDT